MFFEVCIIAIMNLVCGLFIIIVSIILMILLKSNQGKSPYNKKEHLLWAINRIDEKISNVCDDSSLSREKLNEWLLILNKDKAFLEEEYKKI